MPTRAARHEIEQLQAQRRARILTAWLAGHSIEAIAHDLGVRPDMVTRTVRENPGAATERARRDAQKRARLVRCDMAWSQRHPGRPLAEAAAALQLPPDVVRGLLGERASLHPMHNAGRASRVGDDEILAVLRDFARGGDLRMDAYRAVGRQHDWPAISTIVQRYGSWRAALAAAGVEVPAPVVRQRWSDERLWQWVHRYLATPGPWSLTGMGQWLHTQPEAPSVGLVRQRLGGWNTILTGLDAH